MGWRGWWILLTVVRIGVWETLVPERTPGKERSRQILSPSTRAPCSPSLAMLVSAVVIVARSSDRRRPTPQATSACMPAWSRWRSDLLIVNPSLGG